MTQETNCSGDNPEKYEPKISCKMQSSCHMSCCQNIQPLEPSAGPIGQVSMCRSVSDHSIRRPITCTLLLSLASMPSETRESLIAKLAAYGEHLSPKLTVLQLKGRLAELKSKAEASGHTTLKDQLKMLSKKSKKPPELVQHLKELGLEPTANQTIAQMYVMAETFLIKNAPPSPLDTVGFGQFAGLTCGQVMQDHPQYCQWVSTTSKETDTCWRLARLATWLMSTDNQEHAEIPKSSKTKHASNKQVIAQLRDSHCIMATTSRLWKVSRNSRKLSRSLDLCIFGFPVIAAHFHLSKDSIRKLLNRKSLLRRKELIRH